MSIQLNVLLVEDSENDALLLIRHLKKGGYDPQYTRVFDQHDLDQALGSQRWDIAISDHNMPNFSSELALRSIRKVDRDLPVIIVSGTIGEEQAVKAMRLGAHDYIMKDDLARLLPAVERELREALNRKSHHEAEQKIRYMASHDALTGLINRYSFEEKLIELLSTVNQGLKHAFLYIDLDQFKIVNDTSGHVAGDELLRKISSELQNVLGGEDMLARLGGDEFGVLLENCSLTVAESIAEKIIKAVKAFQFTWKDRTFTLGASIGLVMINAQQHDPAEIMSAADIACYTAKDSGRNRVHVYHPDNADMARLQVEMEWVSTLQAAIAEDHFRLYTQCIQPLTEKHKNLRCYEFLLRLVADNGNIIMPDSFIPAAERYDLMPDIDRWVIDHVLAYMAEKKEKNDVLCFVNLSANTIDDITLTAFIHEKLEQYQVPAHCVCFEITETAAISNQGAAIQFIHEIRNLGCLFALDDFGTGMSSFSYLRSLPVDFIKIDGEFVRNMGKDKMSKAIVEAINSIGHVAGLETIGEHTESEEILQTLKELGVDFAQGYVIQKPVEI
ncbi:MAG: EAL domain-containing protein [Pseudomonadota bacterium]|nr:EAL domain-containing protein [Pseudomonadota bacterium]